MRKNFDLLSTVEYGGCSAKLPAGLLSEMLSDFPIVEDANLLVDIQTHDDAGVYKINDQTALIFTADFFPPLCSDPYEFGEIAAANALSDVYAMGGKPLMALNLMMFDPARIPPEVFREILKGGADKAREAGTLIVGGHTIDDHPPKYGMSVIGTVHPDELITNAGAEAGDILILTKPLGTGAVLAGFKNDLTTPSNLQKALDLMKVLNREASELAVKYNVHAMTDITGFGLLGHALKMAEASQVSFRINTEKLPLLEDAYAIFDSGCIPGATFRNLEFTGDQVHYAQSSNYNLKMLAHDAQTSGGMLLSVNPDLANDFMEAFNGLNGSFKASVIGEVLMESPRRIYLE